MQHVRTEPTTRIDPADQAEIRARVNSLARGFALGVVLALIGSAAFLHMYGRRFGSLISVEAIDSSQVAVNLLRQHKLVTDVVYPPALLEGDRDGYDIRVGPLYPILLAVFFRLREASDTTVALCNGLLHLLTAWALFSIMKQVYTRRVAILAVLGYLISMEAVGQALTASPVTTAALLVTVATLLAIRLLIKSRAQAQGGEQSPAAGGRAFVGSALLCAVGMGLALGLAYLTGVVAVYSAILFGAVAIGLLRREWRVKAAMTTAIAGAVIVVPWFGYNMAKLGRPIPVLRQVPLLFHTRTFPGYSALWTVDDLPNPVKFALSHPTQMGLKVINGLSVVYRQVSRLTNVFLFPFLFLGLFFWARESDEERLLWRLLAAGLIAQIVAICLTDFDVSAMNVFVPTATGMAIAVLAALVRQRVNRRATLWAVGTVAAVVLAFPYATSVGLGPRRSSPSAEVLGGIRALAQATHGCTIASDSAWYVAWYGEARALMLPQDPDALVRLGSRFREYSHPDLVYLSRDLPGLRGRQDAWLKAVRGDAKWTPMVQKWWPVLTALPGDEYLLMREELRNMLQIRPQTDRPTG